jgi:hypothetical protein
MNRLYARAAIALGFIMYVAGLLTGVLVLMLFMGGQ